MLDVIHSILNYSWRDYDYTIFVRYLLGTAYLPSPLDKITYYFFATLVPKPETMVLIDVKPQAAYKRIRKRTNINPEMFEKPEDLEKIRRKGIALASIGNWQIIDGSKPPTEVEFAIRRLLKHG